MLIQSQTKVVPLHWLSPPCVTDKNLPQCLALKELLGDTPEQRNANLFTNAITVIFSIIKSHTYNWNKVRMTSRFRKCYCHKHHMIKLVKYLPQVSSLAVLHSQQWQVICGHQLLHPFRNVPGCHNVDMIQPEWAEIRRRQWDTSVLRMEEKWSNIEFSFPLYSGLFILFYLHIFDLNCVFGCCTSTSSLKKHKKKNENNKLKFIPGPRERWLTLKQQHCRKYKSLCCGSTDERWSSQEW